MRIRYYFANSIDPQKRQNFLTQIVFPQRQGTSQLSFKMFLSLNIFWNVNFDYQFIKPSRILIFECVENFSAQISLTQKKDRTFFPHKFWPQRQSTSLLNFQIFLSLNTFLYINLDCWLFKPSKILIFDCAENFSAQ